MLGVPHYAEAIVPWSVALCHGELCRGGLCHGRGLSPCQGVLWVSHHVGVTRRGTCSVTCATCTVLGHATCAVLGKAVPQCPNPGQGSVCQCRAYCAYWNVQVRCIGAGLYRVSCTEGLICGGGLCTRDGTEEVLCARV